MNRSIPLLVAGLAIAGGALAEEKASTGLEMQEARAEGLKTKGMKSYYPADKWDLSDLPAYVPKEKVSGTLRIWGSNYIVDSPLAGYWEKAFQKFHPGVKFEYKSFPAMGHAMHSIDPALYASTAIEWFQS